MTSITMNLELEASKQELSMFEAIIHDIYHIIKNRPGYKPKVNKLNNHRYLIKFERSILKDPDAINRIAYFKDHGYTMEEVMAALKETYGEEPESP
jgi:hypothetical protein